MFAILISILTLVLPLPGTTYSSSISIPFIGKQYIETRFLRENIIDITLEGIVSENGTAQYIVYDNEIDIELSNNLQIMMKKRRSEFIFKSYDYDKDYVYIQLYVKPIYFKKILTLKRK